MTPGGQHLTSALYDGYTFTMTIFIGEPDEPVYDEPDSFYWNPVEQGMYDDDPSPYDGNYSEM